jgi:hypothetical protein
VAHVAAACVGDGDFHHDDTVFVTHDAVNAAKAGRCSRRCCATGPWACSRARSWSKPDAQKTDGYQISQSLLLDDDSEFLAKPELEIYADDVACSHGSTSGAIDEDGAVLPALARGAGVPGDGPPGAGLPGRGDREIEDGGVAAETMSVSRDIVATWRRPRTVMRSLLAQGRREDRALMFLILACGIIFVSQWPVISREAALDARARRFRRVWRSPSSRG